MGFKTFVAGDVLTAAEVNDYLMEQAVIACTSGTRPSSPNEGMTIYQTDTDTFAVYNGTSWLETTPEGATVATSENTTSTSYTDLATSGPAVTLTTGTKVLVTVGCQMSNNTGGSIPLMSFAVSSATTRAASNNEAFAYQAYTNGGSHFGSRTAPITGLTAGSNVFTAKYSVSGNTGTFLNRHIVVEAIP